MHIHLGARLRLGTLALLAATAASQAIANPIDFVTVSATQFYGGTANNYDSLTGLYQHPGGGVAATFTSDPSNTLGLTNATVATTASEGTTTIATATSSAAANLATGILGVYSTGNCSPPSVNCAAESNGTAQMRDLLTFTDTTGTTQDITVSFAFDGTVTFGGAVDRNEQNVTLCFVASTFCAGQFEEFTYTDGSIEGATPATLTTPTTGWVSTSIIPGMNGYSDTFMGVFAVPTGMSNAFMSAMMSVDCGEDGTTCDFSHTGALSLSLPTGVSFTSASGVLLTESPAAVPEPRPLSVVGLALAVGTVARFKRRRINVRI
jgi:hypothetical protein